MGETHGRSLGWSTTDVWPVPVECLLNGMTGTETQLMFGGGQFQFRQRFQGSLSESSPQPLPSHSLNGTVATNQQLNSSTRQESLSQPIPLRDEVLEESEETSEDEELNGRMNPNDGGLTIGHPMRDEGLVQVQCVEQVPIVQDALGHQQLDPHSHHQKLGNVMQQHPLQPHSHPQPTGTPMMPIFFQHPEAEFNEQEEESVNDPNTGFSVYGKLYYEREGRVVLHLKQQWGEGEGGNEGGMAFGPEEIHRKSHLLQGCALCRLRSEGSEEGYRTQKQAHRHTFRGVLFTFEECMIVEIYPEQFIGISNQNGLKTRESQAKLSQNHSGQGQMSMGYMEERSLVRGVEGQLTNEELMDMNPLVQPPQQEQTHQEKPDTHQAWWEEFESDGGRNEDDDSSELSEDEAEHRGSPIQGEEIHGSSCMGGLKEQSDSTYHEDSTYLSTNENVEVARVEEDPEPTSQLESLALRTPQHSRSEEESLENLTTPTNHESSEQELNFGLVEVGAEEDLLVQAPGLASQLQVQSTLGGKRNYSCPCCSRRFPLKKSLKSHLEMEHGTQNPFCCQNCLLQLSDEKQLLKHSCAHILQKHRIRKRAKTHGVQQETCNGVESQIPSSRNAFTGFTSESGRSQNNKTDSVTVMSNDNTQIVEEKFVIERRSSQRKKERKGRGKFRHKKSGQSHSSIKKTKALPCNICGKNFTVQRRLETHRLSHGRESFSECEKCGKRFARKDKLIRHMYVHSEEKMFVCSICVKRFSRRDKLADHLKSHGGPDEIHHCPLCKKAFLRPDILKQHLKLHAMGNKHQCTECLRFVTGKERLHQHMARHEEAKAQGQPLLCPLCTKNFIQRQSLKAHIKKFHPTAHERLLSDLDFPTDPGLEDLEGEEEKKLYVEKKPFMCLTCPYPKRFSKKGALKRHQVKHHQEQEHRLSLTKTRKSSKPKLNKINGIHRYEVRWLLLYFPEIYTLSLFQVEKRKGSEDSQGHSHTAALRPITFTSAASQIVSPPPSPPTSQSPTLLSTMEPIPAHIILSTTHPPTPPMQHHLTLTQSHQHTQLHLTTSQPPTPHIPIPLTPVSVTPEPPQQNGLLMTNHTLSNHTIHQHHPHHLLQHSTHPLTQGLSLMPQSQGQLHPHVNISHMSMHHHVTLSNQQAMCGTPYVIYPQYYQ